MSLLQEYYYDNDNNDDVENDDDSVCVFAWIHLKGHYTSRNHQKS